MATEKVKAELMDAYSYMGVCPLCNRTNLISSRSANDTCQHYVGWFTMHSEGAMRGPLVAYMEFSAKGKAKP